MKENYEEKTEKLLEPIVASLGFSVVDVEYVKEGADYYLRAYIDKEGGITVDDCEKVSRSLEEKLDTEDFIPNAYILEVSSPGLGRQLKKEKHYLANIGEKVDVKLYKAIDKVKDFVGILKAYENGRFVFEVDGKKIELEASAISKINLHVDW
ncbi:MAG: ribosome maturation factor RimP [Lachnospiraceae bacterium]|nr:ribosome maturation factor RimP [Lachnospiraceae bacterium]